MESAGIHPFVLPNNNGVVSFREKDAIDVVSKAKKWLEILQESPILAPLLAHKSNAHEIKFLVSGFHIRSETQSKDSLRGFTGHVRLDEHGAYAWSSEIWASATGCTTSHPGLRISVVSTPKPNTQFQEFWEDVNKYSQFSRHKTDVYEAVEQGYNPQVLETESMTPAWVWSQEFECKFLGGTGSVFDKELLESAYHPYTYDPNRVTWIGLDVASGYPDTTCAVVIYVQSDGVWIGDSYQIAGVQTETNIETQVAGLELIVDALIRHLGAYGCATDITGDQARFVRGWTPLYACIRHHRGHDTALPQIVISQSWKAHEVDELRNALSTGRTKLIQGRSDYLFDPSKSTHFVVAKNLPDNHATLTPSNFVNATFGVQAFPLLEKDFATIRAIWKQNGITYDSNGRNRTGHADSFWALVCGHSIARLPHSQRGGSGGSGSSTEGTDVAVSKPDYTNMW